MDEIFGSTGWAQPLATASEEGPQSLATSSRADPTTQPQKKRKGNTFDVTDLWKEMKEEKQIAAEEKERNRERRHIEKNKKLDELMAQKERCHNEKMEIMRLWLQSTQRQ